MCSSDPPWADADASGSKSRHEIENRVVSLFLIFSLNLEKSPVGSLSYRVLQSISLDQ